MHKRLALVLLVAGDPVTRFVALGRVVHERVCTPATLVQAIVGKTMITVTDCSVAFLLTAAVPVTHLLASVSLAKTNAFAEAISVTIIAIDALGAVQTRELRVAHAHIRPIMVLDAVGGSDRITVTRRSTYNHVE